MNTVEAMELAAGNDCFPRWLREGCAAAAKDAKNAERYLYAKTRAHKDGSTLCLEVAVMDDVAVGDFGRLIDEAYDRAIAASAVGAA